MELKVSKSFGLSIRKFSSFCKNQLVILNLTPAENLDIEGLENCYRKQKIADAQEEKETRAMHYEALARITANKKVKEIKERLNGKT